MSGAARPYTLVAELTYRCPLRCAYCSNPVRYEAAASELDVVAWTRVLTEAADLGIMQVHFTGGEPLLYGGLDELVREASRRDLYASLITSAVPLSRERLARLADAGLLHVQISIQSTRSEVARDVAGVDALAAKLEACGWAKELGLALTINVVIHRMNAGEVPAFVALAEQVGADRLEIAHTQYLGWAALNRLALLPSKECVDEMRATIAEQRELLRDRMEITSVLPDHHASRPRACMDGWARRYVVVTPDGLALPCHAARDLPLRFEDVRERGLARIWNDSPAFEAFRGESWMREPCASCDRREIDFGGCRCQAFAWTGDAAATDPVCQHSPHHALVESAVAAAASPGEAEIRLRRLPMVAS
jgi:pyrroloquinoline quinone biosynthesis protein E